jgi:hypothetical protein
MDLVIDVFIYLFSSFFLLIFFYILVRCSTRAFFRSYYEIASEEKKNGNEDT